MPRAARPGCHRAARPIMTWQLRSPAPIICCCQFQSPVVCRQAGRPSVYALPGRPAPSPCFIISDRNLMRTLEEGRSSTCFLPRFSALYMVFCGAQHNRRGCTCVSTEPCCGARRRRGAGGASGTASALQRRRCPPHHAALLSIDSRLPGPAGSWSPLLHAPCLGVLQGCCRPAGAASCLLHSTATARCQSATSRALPLARPLAASIRVFSWPPQRPLAAAVQATVYTDTPCAGMPLARPASRPAPRLTSASASTEIRVILAVPSSAPEAYWHCTAG